MKDKMRCSKCKKEKSINLFYKSSTRSTGFSAYCKNCYRLVKIEWRNKNREYMRIKSMETKMKNYKATLARNALYRAKKSGKIKPTNCIDCGSDIDIQAHHHKGYELENRLDVVWLCQLCHKKKHHLSLEGYQLLALENEG